MKGYNDNLKNSQVPLNFNNIRDQYNSTNPLNNQDKDLSSLNSSMIDISEYMNSIKEEEYKSYIKKKYDIIVRTFQEIDTNKDSSIDFNELITYLNKGMTV
jgi:Ca2+-binding EF-hand superfamily protein